MLQPYSFNELDAAVVAEREINDGNGGFNARMAGSTESGVFSLTAHYQVGFLVNEQLEALTHNGVIIDNQYGGPCFTFIRPDCCGHMLILPRWHFFEVNSLRWFLRLSARKQSVMRRSSWRGSS